MFKNKFKKFGGEFIPDIVEYLKNYINDHPTTTISIGCDSIQKRKKTMYAVTIMLYETDIKKGAHVIFYRENLVKIKNHFERLQKEAQYMHDLGEYLTQELSFYNRDDINDYERKRYKFHLAKCNGEYSHVPDHYQDSFTRSMLLTDSEKIMEYKPIDIHLDFNPAEGITDKRGYAKNKSNISYHSFVPWLRGMGYRVWAKPNGFAATSAADLLLQD